MFQLFEDSVRSEVALMMSLHSFLTIYAVNISMVPNTVVVLECVWANL